MLQGLKDYITTVLQDFADADFQRLRAVVFCAVNIRCLIVLLILLPSTPSGHAEDGYQKRQPSRNSGTLP